MTTLPLNSIVQMVLNLSPQASPRNGFNLGLIIGKSTHISANDRVKLVTGLPDMIDLSFATNDPEYLAAEKYFAAPSQPTQLLIGRWDGTGAETAAQAIQACRNVNNNWYACTVCGVTESDIPGAAAAVEAMVPDSAYFYTTNDSDALAGTQTNSNIFYNLKHANYRRSLGVYSSTTDAAASIMGYAMGANTGLANSAYTLRFKKMPGVTPESLTSDQVSAIETQNGNVYINRGSYYDMFEPGLMADGTHFDELVNLDKLANDIQLNVMDALYGNKKIPQTEGGIGILKTVIGAACEQAKKIGFIAPGQWNGPNILTLSTGSTLPNGYIVLSESIDSQSQADRDARKAPPIYVCIKLAGAIESVIIEINVNR